MTSSPQGITSKDLLSCLPRLSLYLTSDVVGAYPPGTQPVIPAGGGATSFSRLPFLTAFHMPIACYLRSFSFLLFA